MKRIGIALMMLLLLTGCKVQQEIKLDTIVDIPLHPTETQTQAPAETASVQTEPVPTEAAAKDNDTGNQTSTKSSGQSSKSSGKTAAKDSGKTSAQHGGAETATQPPETQPVTEAPTEPATEAPTAAQAYDPTGYSPGSLDRGVADAVNAQRAAAGLAPLTLDTRLCAVASVRAREASVNWSHTRPDGSGWQTVLTQYGYACSTAAENLYFGTGSADSIVKKWMSSDAHKDNILMTSATAIGVGSYTAEDGLTYVAALFVG